MYEQIASNKRKTFLLLFVAFALLGAIGYAIGLMYGSGWVGFAIAAALAVVIQLFSYFSGDKLVLASARAREVTSEQEPRLHNIVEGLAIAAGVPKPRVYVVPEQAPNAFATGRDPEHSSIAVTQGLLDTMDRVELEGVIGHEMSHVVDRDILYGTIVATVIGAIVLISEFFMRSWWWGGIGGRRGGDRYSGGGGGQMIVFAIGFALVILAPIFGQLIQLAVSRNREYLADAQGALLTQVPAWAHQRAQEDPGRAARHAFGEQRHRPHVAEPTVADPGGGDRPHGAVVLHAPADRRSGSGASRRCDDPVEMTAGV